MGTIKESLTFDDVLLLPRYSNVLPSDTNISLNLNKFLFFKYKNKIIELTQDEIVVAIGIIIKPILLK